MIAQHPPYRRRTHRADVMVSSTTRDMPDHRRSVIDAIWRRGMFPLAMERDTADTASAVEYSLELVNQSEVYVGIFGNRYGYIPDHIDNPARVSITEMEYNRARVRQIPILIFIMADHHPVVSDDDPDEEETGQKKEQLRDLKQRLKHDHVVGFFTSPDDLGAQVYQALTRLKDQGLIADDAVTSTGTTSRIPHPPDRYAAHPYLMRQDFFGRRKELKLLDDWAASPSTVMIVEAIGGVGKSALTWEWFNSRPSGEFDGLLWWSFYESDSAISNFTRHALAYVTGRLLDPSDGTSQYEREERLLNELCQGRYLLVLDGLERIMVAYHRPDAARIPDDQVDVNRRDCTDPRSGAFLQRLTRCPQTKVLISTRLMPAVLENRAGQPLPGVDVCLLDGLHPDDALTLMRYLKVRGDEAALRRFMAQFKHHSLLLTVLAGHINDFRPAPGDFDAWYEHEGHRLRLPDVNLAQRRTNILQFALEGLKPELRKLLSQIAAFRYRIGHETVMSLNPYTPPPPTPVPQPSENLLAAYRQELADTERTDPDNTAKREYLTERINEIEADLPDMRAGYTAYQDRMVAYRNSEAYQASLRQFYAGLRELEDRGLLQWDRVNNDYDLHPIVRSYAFEDLKGEERRAAFARIRTHFEKLPPTPLEEVRGISDLTRELEIYHALIGQDLLDPAAEFYSTRLSRVLHNRIAAYETMVTLLRPLFTNGIDQLPTLSSPEQQSACLNSLASAYYYLGQNGRALRLKALKLGLNLKGKDDANLGVGLRNYASSLLIDNRLAAARRAVELAHDLAVTAEDEIGQAFSHLSLLAVHVMTGCWDAADAAYTAFSANPPHYSTEMWQADAERYRAFGLICRGLDAAGVLDRAWELAHASADAFSQRHIHHLRGEVALQQERILAAVEHFQDAITLARKHGVSELAAYLGYLARALAIQGRHDLARATITEAFNLPYTVQRHDLHNSAAEVFLALDERDIAAQHALDAYRLAWADGPPFAWWWSLERATRSLAALDLAPPDLPRYEPDSAAPLPHEDDIRARIEALRVRPRRV
ncbi:MAG: DUF4062 domain-containing protein [Anaerolineae bacterium]|nr:DUF4062 domain-containing protein [Anaerolineae bacterium]